MLRSRISGGEKIICLINTDCTEAKLEAARMNKTHFYPIVETERHISYVSAIIVHLKVAIYVGPDPK